MNNIIECRNLCYKYNDGASVTPILENLELTVAAGESVAILGQSGCGKSTLLNLLSGMDKPNQGEVLLNQVNLNTLNENKITSLRAEYLGFVYQFHHLLKDFSALDNVLMPLLIRGDERHLAVQKSTALLTDVGLKHRLHHLPSQLSGGERQRAAVARALITKPHCLLADEPTGNLDSKNTLTVLNLIIALNQTQKSALLIVTHDEKIAAKMNRVLTLSQGKLK